MEMFGNMGKAIALLRGLRGKSQSRLAREAGIGKSQLSKYETGRELPKLETLERVLRALDVSLVGLAWTVDLLDRLAGELTGSPGAARWLPGPTLLSGLLSGQTEQAFTRLLSDLTSLYRQVVHESLARGAAATRRSLTAYTPPPLSGRGGDTS